MISLRQLLNEVMGLDDESDLEESKAGEEAKRLGLTYMRFGRYGKDGKVTHKSVGGKLQPIKGGDAKGPAKASAKVPAKPAAVAKGKSSAPAAPTPKVSDKIKAKYKSYRGTGDGGLAQAEILAGLFATPREQKQLQAAKKHRRTSPYVGDTVKSKKYAAFVDVIIKKYEPRLGLEPEAPRDSNALTPKNRNTKTDTKAVKKHLTTRYQSALRANSIDIIDDSVPGILLLGTPGGGNTTDFMAIGQQKDGQWVIRPVRQLDKKGHPVFYDNDDDFTVEPTLDAAMQSHYGIRPSKQPQQPAKNDNYRR